MAATDTVEQVVEAGGAHVAELMATLEQRLAEVAAGCDGELAGHASATIAAGGKRMRPLLLFIAAGPGVADVEALVRSGVAVELVHSATLVHDDVLDAAALRRGRPTVAATAGRRMATAVGDYLFSRAFSELTRNGDPEAVRVLSSASSALAQGELLQREDAWDAGVTVERYLRRCELKTGRLFSASCELGSLAAGRPAAELSAFGHGIGLAFQLLDDVLDVTGPPERTGKPRGADLLDGTVTLPFILARAAEGSLSELDPRDVDTPERAATVADAITASGALESTRTQALELVAEAKRELPAEGDPRRRALELLADSVVERYS
jgi:geranylgeranyl pyrophosphate synthase